MPPGPSSGFLGLSGRGGLAGGRRARPALARFGHWLALGLRGRQRDLPVSLQLLQPRAEFLQPSLQVVKPVTEYASALLSRTPKPRFEGHIGPAQHGLDAVGTVGTAHFDETVRQRRACVKLLAGAPIPSRSPCAGGCAATGGTAA